MADTPNSDRPSLRPNPRVSLRPEPLATLLDRPIEDEGKVLDALVAGLSSGETTPELFARLHDAVVAQERVANLSFAYERIARDNRIKLLAKQRQADFFLAAARFFGDIFGDVDAAIGFAERALTLAPDDAQVFDQLETLLASAQQGGKLAKLYTDSAARAKDRKDKLRLLRAAIELLEAFAGSPDDILAIYKQVVELDPEDRSAQETLEKLYLGARRLRELAELLERSVVRAATVSDAAVDELRLRLVGLYRGELRDPTRAAPHVEALLSRDPIGAAALQAAEALVDHRPVAARIAPILSDAYRRLGRLEDEASTLALELKVARPPRLADVHRRLAILRQDVLSDPAGALELLEPLVSRDPGDDELRGRYLQVSATFHRELEAAKVLARAIASAKSVEVRATVSLEIATLYAKQGDTRRARAALEPFVEDVPSDPSRLAIAKRVVELHQDGTDPKGLARVLDIVVRNDPDLPGRMAAAKHLVELCEGTIDDPALAIVAWRVLLGSTRSDEALDRLEALYASTGDDAGTIDVLSQRAARAKDPEQTRAFAFRAAELRAARAPDRARAIEAWREYLGTFGPSPDALGRLATLLEQHRDFRGLSDVLLQLVPHGSSQERAATFSRLAQIRLVELRDVPGALEALGAALTHDPKDGNARRLAERLLADGAHRLDAASLLEPVYRAEPSYLGIVRVLETRAELAPDVETELLSLEEAHGIADAKMADPRRALDLAGHALARAARGSWNDVPAWLARFRHSATRAGDPSRRAELLGAAIERVSIDRPEAGELGREAAEALVTAGELGRAIETYRRVLAFEPSSADVLRRVDELLVEQGSPDERLALYRAALERENEPGRRRDLLHAIAKIQRRDLVDLPGTIETLRTLASESREDVAVHEALVEAYFALGDRAALAAELEQALDWTVGERRLGVVLRLAHECVHAGERPRALSLYRQLVLSDELPAQAFEEVEALAETEGDADTLAVVLDRRILSSSDPLEQSIGLEKLGDVRAKLLGDTAGAADAWRLGARISRDLEGGGERAARLYERLLDGESADREAARYLVDAYARGGSWAKVPPAFAALLRSDSSHEPIELLLALEEDAIRAGAVDELVTMADEATFAQAHDAARRSRELMALKARALASIAERRNAAAAIWRGLVQSFGETADVESFRRFLSETKTDASTFEDQRWLFAYRAGRSSNATSALSEWADAEEHLMHDVAAAVRVYEEVLALDPGHVQARDAVCRLQLERGDAAGLLRVLSGLSERLGAEDRLDVDLRVAAVLVEHLGRAEEALGIIRAVLERAPGHSEALRIAREMLLRPESRVEAAALFARVVATTDGPGGEALLTALLDETRGAPGLEGARSEWYARLIELSLADPLRALGVAVQAAEEMPAEMALWEAAERLARRASEPRIVADAYARTLANVATPGLGEAVGRRFVEFHEEWFDDPVVALGLLERVLEISPRARWALDRIKLSYNADARWEELFALYDRAIEGAIDVREREDLLDEAALAAKDLANDSERATGYLERLYTLRPDARVESMLERLYDRTGRAKELLVLLEKRVGLLAGSELVRLRARLARLQLDLGDISAAFALIEQVQHADPDEPVAYALLERLVKMPLAQTIPPPNGKSIPPSRKSAPPSAKKLRKKGVPKDVRREAVRLLEARCRSTADRAGLARALEAALDLAENAKERRSRLEELLSLYEGALPDGERAFVHLSSLVTLDPRSSEYRSRFAEVARSEHADERRAELLGQVAEAAAELPLKIVLLREAAAVLQDIGHRDAAIAAYRRVLEWSLGDAASTLDVAATLDPLLAEAGRVAERCDVLDRAIAVEADAPRRQSLLATLARVAFEELGDAGRAASAWRALLDESPRDLAAFSGLETTLESAGRFRELVEVLARRVTLEVGDEARRARVRIARIYFEKIGDAGAAIETWRALRQDLGADEETFAALSKLFELEARWDELASLVEHAASAAERVSERIRLYRILGDLHRDRTGKPVQALTAYVKAGDFERTTTVVDRSPDRETVLLVASTLLDLAVKEWDDAEPAAKVAIADAAYWAVETLVRRYLEAGMLEQVVETQLRGASLPFERGIRRKLRRDAAWTCSDRLDKPERAIVILHELFQEDPADEIALASVTRFARLLDEAGRHPELATLWEDQARCRSDAGDRAGSAALWARAARIWETDLRDVDRAIAVHRQGAALGGETSLESLARIYGDRKNHRAAALALEWLCAQSGREELAERVLRLADTYLALGEWEHARERLEHAARVAIDAGAVRQRLSELYRRHGAWEPLCALLVAEAERAPDDKARLSLLREAAGLHFAERGDPSASVPLLERAIEIDPDDPTLRLALSEAFRGSGRYDAAAAVLRAQVERYGHRRPKDRALVHLYLARVSLAAGRRAEALGELDIGSKINPAHPGILYELGKLALEEGQLARAERTYRGLLLVLRKPGEDAGEAPGRAEIYLDLSEIAARQGETERATELVESAFEAALDSPTDAVSLERALRRSERYGLLARAIETRLQAAVDPATAARALSDLVLLHAEHPEGEKKISGRVQDEAGRIHRDLELQSVADVGAWAAMTSVYEWLGDPAAEARALERRVEAALESDLEIDVEPVLRLASIRLMNPDARDDGVKLLGRALDAGADSDRAWTMLRDARVAAPRHGGVLELMERIAREPGRERSFVEVMALRAAAGPVGIEGVREAAVLARRFSERDAEIALLRGALEHGGDSHAAADGAWLRETLARLLLEDGAHREAADLLERAAILAGPERRHHLVLEAARLTAGMLGEQDRAARLYRTLLERDASDRDAWEPLLELYRKADDREQLIALIGSTAPHVESVADRGRLRFEEATLMLAEKDRTDAAIRLLSDIVAEDPTMHDAARLLASLLEEQGRMGELLALVRSELDLAKSNAATDRVEALSMKLGELLERQGESARARLAYGRVLDWNPVSRDALRAMVRLDATGEGSRADAADAIERLLAIEEGAAVAPLAARLVELRTEAGDAPGVERALEVACAANPLDSFLREQLVAICLERNDWVRAAEVLRRAAEADTVDFALLLRAVEAYEHGGKLDEAIETLGVALGRTMGDADLYLERARILGDAGQHDAALDDIEAAHAAGAGKAPELMKALEAAVARSEGEVRARHALRLVDLLESVGETTAAREQLAELVKTQPKHKEALRRLASLAAAEARWDQAAATYRRLIVLEEGDALVAAAMNLADACEHSGHLADARGGLERALETLPESADLRTRLRQLYESTGATRELAHLLLKDGQRESDVATRTSSLLRAAELLLEREGDAAEAVSVLTDVRRLLPESIHGAVLLARAHSALGKLPEAMTALEDVVTAHRGRRSKDLALVHREISHIHLENGNLNAALEALSRAFDLDMRNGEFAMQLGHLALDVGDTETAAKAFRSVTMMRLKTLGSAEGASAESKAVAYYHLSRLAQAQGDVRKARLMATKAVSENPNHTEAQALLKELRI